MSADRCNRINLASEEVARLIIEHAAHYAIMIMDREGRIITWSPGAVRMTGYSTVEELNMPFAAIFTPSDQAAGED
jgi:PAS domain S-box-containing protein